jgi:CheY-like chemotaxis protein
MASRHREHILLVEDDADTLDATTAMLERQGYSVRTEREGLKALRTFSEEPDRFDLALIDYGMPDVTGLELARQMGRIRPGFPIVLYTGYLDDPSAEQLDAAGMAGRVMLKPATLKELTDALQEVLGDGQRV